MPFTRDDTIRVQLIASELADIAHIRAGDSFSPRPKGPQIDSVRHKAARRAERSFSKAHFKAEGRWPGLSETPFFMAVDSGGHTSKTFPWVVAERKLKESRAKAPRPRSHKLTR